jgi:heme O synthase-like polyprenyltransferase
MEFFKSLINKAAVFVEFLVYMVVGLTKSVIYFITLVLELSFYLIPAYVVFLLGVWAAWFLFVKNQEPQSFRRYLKTNKWFKYSFYTLTIMMIVLVSWKENYAVSLYYYIKSIF